MIIKEVSLGRKEIEMKLVGIGDYVKLDYLQQCLKKQLDFDTRRFVLTTLTGIYESRKMFYEAGKMIRAAADINTTFNGKMNDFLKSALLFIKSGNYVEADISMAKATGSANDAQKVGIKIKIKEAYKEQAKEFMKRDKRKHAMETYEKILLFDLNPLEKKEAQKSLLELYEKLGKVKEFYTLQKASSP